MATQLQIRRGTTSQMNAFTGAEGELAVNTTTDTVHVHDGSTAGGHALAKADGSNIAAYAGSFTTLAASGAATLNTLASSGATLTGGTINGVTVGATTPSTGAFTTIAASGAITGNVTGNLTGSVLTAAQTNITSVGTLSALTVSGALTVDTNTLVVDATNNRVGINNSSPVEMLTVGSTSDTNVRVQFLSSTTGGNTIQFGDGTGAEAYSGYINYTHSDDVLAFATGGSERMRILGGSVGIGTSSPSTYDSRANNLVVGDSGDAGVTIFSGATSDARLVFAASGDTGLANGVIGYDNNNDSLAFEVAGSEAMRISGGNLGVGVSPAAWNSVTSGRTAVQVGFGSIAGRLNDIQTEFTNNAYAVGTGNTPQWAGITRWSKNQIAMASDGSIVFNNAPTVSQSTFDASPNFTWQERMRISSAGQTQVVGFNAMTMGFPAVSGGASRSGIKPTITGAGLGQLQFLVGGDNNNEATTVAAMLDSSGTLFVGKTAAGFSTDGVTVFFNGQTNITAQSDPLSINRKGSSGNAIGFYINTVACGSISVTTGSTAYNTSSDYRLKENIADADDAGSKIDSIQVRKFDWIADGAHQDYGMVAQELQAVAPEAVSAPEDPDEMMGVDYSKLVPMLVKEIQSLRARVNALETE